MIELTYKSIQPYILEEVQRGEMMYCKFLVEEEEFETEVAIEKAGETKGLSLIGKNPNKMRSMLLRALNKGIRKKEVLEDDVPQVYFSKKELFVKKISLTRARQYTENNFLTVFFADMWLMFHFHK